LSLFYAATTRANSARFTVEHRILTPHTTSPPSNCWFLVPASRFGTFGHPREPKMAHIAHNYYGSLRLACWGRWAAAPKPFKIVTIPHSLLQHHFDLKLRLLHPYSALHSFNLFPSQSQHSLSSTGKRSTSLSCTMLFCMSLLLL
jgi:hypothetical protein